MNRRLFLQLTSSMFASQLFLHPMRALANLKNDHFFVLIQVTNGWDVTLSLDPKTHQGGHDQSDMFIEYQESEIIRRGDLNMGPAFSPMVKHSGDIHIVRGIEMRRDAGHFTNREIIASGYGDGQSALIPVELAASLKSGPLGVLIDSSIPTGLRDTILTEIQSVSSSSSIADMLSMMELSGDDSTFDLAQQGLFSVSSKMDLIKTKMEELDTLGVSDPQIKSIMASFLAEAAFQSSLTIEAELDSHSSHEGTHLNAQTQAWRNVSSIFDAFKSVEYGNGESLFDRTTFMVVSEFARTSALNSSAGKDHNPHANSVLLAGRGVNGGKSSGESFVIGVKDSKFGVAEHISRPIDYRSGEIVTQTTKVTDSVNLIFPENVSATIGEIFGNPKDYYGNKIPAKIIPGVVKTT